MLCGRIGRQGIPTGQKWQNYLTFLQFLRFRRRRLAGKGRGRGRKRAIRGKKVLERAENGGLERAKTAKILRKIAIFEENEKFFEKGVDICFFRGRLLPVRRERDKRKDVRGARADWF